MKCTKWDDNKIKEEIIKVKDKLGICTMPSYNQIEKVNGNSALRGKIETTGGINRWAKELGLEVRKSESRVGEKGEEIAIKLLKEKGYKVENVSAKLFPYDLLVNDNIKIDVKISILNSYNHYEAGLSKIPKCDIYIIICADDEFNVKKVYIIPSCKLKVKQFSISSIKSKYDKYLNNWECLDIYNDFYNKII